MSTETKNHIFTVCKFCGNTDIFMLQGVGKIEEELKDEKTIRELISNIRAFEYIETYQCLKCGKKWLDIFNRRNWLIELIKRYNNGEKRGFCGYCQGCNEISEKLKKETGEEFECIKKDGIWYHSFILKNYYVHNSKCWVEKENE